MAENKDTLVNIGYILASGKVVSNQMELYPTPRHCVNSLNKHHGVKEQALDLIVNNLNPAKLYDDVNKFLAATGGVPPYLYTENQPGVPGDWYYAEDRPTN